MKKNVLLVCFVFLLLIFARYSYANNSEKNQRYYILISIEECKLWLYQLGENGKKELLKEYAVSTVKKNIKKFPIGKGYVIDIIFNPYWYPVKSTRKEFARKNIIIPELVPPGHPLNYMGSFKISLSHSVEGKGTIYRIHGTRKEDRGKIGHRISGGCIRMLNEEGEELARKISVGTEVEIIMKRANYNTISSFLFHSLFQPISLSELDYFADLFPDNAKR